MRTKMEKVAERLFAGAKVGSLKQVREAVKSGANVNLVNDWDDSTPLSWAALGGHIEVVRFLLEEGADPIGENKALIAIENLGEIIRSMGESVAEEVSDIVKDRVDGQEKIAAELQANKNIEVQPLATLPDPPSANGEFDEDPDADDDDDDDEGHPENAMCAAARAGSIEIMELLLAHGARVTDSENSLQELPVTAAARGGHLRACQWLLNKGANGKANYVCSPMHSAAAGGNAEIVKLFLELGVDPNLPEAEDGYIPLHEVTTVAAAKVLVEAGAGTMVDYWIQGDSPMSFAGDSGNADLVEYLASLSQNQEDIDGAREQLEISAGIANKSTCAMIRASWSCNVARFKNCLTRPGVDVNGYDEDSRTALLTACFHNRPQIVGLLLEAGADPNAKGFGSDSDNSPLSELCSNLDEAHPTIVISIAAALLDAGADISTQQEDGSSILHWALSCPALIKLALERGADATLRNGEGLTAAEQVADYLADVEDEPMSAVREGIAGKLGEGVTGFLDSIDLLAQSEMALFRQSYNILRSVGE